MSTEQPSRSLALRSPSKASRSGCVYTSTAPRRRVFNRAAGRVDRRLVGNHVGDGANRTRSRHHVEQRAICGRQTLGFGALSTTKLPRDTERRLERTVSSCDRGRTRRAGPSWLRRRIVAASDSSPRRHDLHDGARHDSSSSPAFVRGADAPATTTFAEPSRTAGSSCAATRDPRTPNLPSQLGSALNTARLLFRRPRT
jgi:hypothetical protein